MKKSIISKNDLQNFSIKIHYSLRDFIESKNVFYKKSKINLFPLKIIGFISVGLSLLNIRSYGIDFPSLLLLLLGIFYIASLKFMIFINYISTPIIYYFSKKFCGATYIIVNDQGINIRNKKINKFYQWQQFKFIFDENYFILHRKMLLGMIAVWPIPIKNVSGKDWRHIINLTQKNVFIEKKTSKKLKITYISIAITLFVFIELTLAFSYAFLSAGGKYGLGLDPKFEKYTAFYTFPAFLSPFAIFLLVKDFKISLKKMIIFLLTAILIFLIIFISEFIWIMYVK